MSPKQQQDWIEYIGSIKHKTPFMVTDLDLIRDNVHKFKNALPNVALHYAIKSNSDPTVLKAIDELVDGYDIASLGEFKQLTKLGVNSERMLYSNPVKIPEHIKKTYDKGVSYYAFDSLDEIKKLAKYAPGADVYLRLKVSDYGSKFPLSKKFGLDPLYAVAYMGMAKEHGLNARGLAFSVRSSIRKHEYME